MASATAQVRVVTTIPDLANLAREIGGKQVNVRSLSKGTENLHSVHVRPSMLIALSKANLFLEMGLSMEAAWLPGLLLKAKNSKIQPGAPGFENCSTDWQAIGIPADLSRKGGDVHPEGNPHFNLDPMGGAHLAKRIHQALVRVDSAHAELYTKNLKVWQTRLAQKQKHWAAIAERIKGKKIAVYHSEYDYLARRLGLEVVASIEPKPGVPPGPGDIAKVVKTIRATQAKVILSAAWSNNRQVSDIAKKAGATVIELPNQVGGAPWAETWLDLMDGVYERLDKAFAAER
jgi:zinc/manganese transport system substrate-binding protein